MKTALKYFENTCAEIDAQGLTKGEKIITSPQGARVNLSDGREVINMCANNYLGLANDPEVIASAKKSYDEYGYGLSSVRFICGTQKLHKELEAKLSRFLGTDDTILYSSCFDANGGLFETLLTDEDAIISDELNHASIIDGVRLCKAKRFRYKNNDMTDLRAKLEEAKDARIKLIATDGVFSMDGIVADLKSICDLADEYDALVMVDDSHAAGFMGKTGRGTAEHCGVQGRVDIITGTFGKALLIVGSSEYMGAAALALEAALRGGAGYVSFVGGDGICDFLLSKFPEALYNRSQVSDTERILKIPINWFIL
jgi:glycine C-acetyltransferase